MFDAPDDLRMLRGTMTQNPRPLLAILGPTASGKTALGIEVAKKFNGEVISADSRQIYVGMDIGTDKTGYREQRTGNRNEPIVIEGIPHYLIDIRTPDQPYSVSEFRNDAQAVIELIQKHGNLPIVVGGTGHYIRALTEHAVFSEVPPDPVFRTWADAQSLDALVSELTQRDATVAARIDKKNRRRVVRALEIARGGKTISHASAPQTGPLHLLKLALTPPADLRERIARRVDEQLAAGLIEEVQRLVAQYEEAASGLQAIAYREVFPYLRKEVAQGEMRDAIIRASWQYARRQMTWLRKEPNLVWITSVKEALTKVNEWHREK